MTKTRRKIVLVGHCGPDIRMLQAAVSRVLPETEITAANDAVSLARQTGSESILLVNRVLDGDFENDSGIDLIRQLAAKPEKHVLMLISNHEEAQREAVEAGAIQGFGKTQLYASVTAELLRAAMMR